MVKKLKTFDFESALRELENLVEKMETGELSLEESLQQFERGVLLTRACQKALADAEQRVKILTVQNDSVQVADYEPSPPCSDASDA